MTVTPNSWARRCAGALRTAGLATLALALLAALATPRPVSAEDAKAREIMQKVNDRDDGDNMTSEMEMTLIDRSGNRRERRIKSYRKDKGQDTQSIVFFLSPADVKDTGFLTYDYDAPGKDDDQWLYLPALRKTKRIASDDKSGSFMGSDFNFSDMTRPDLDDYTFTLMKEVEVGGQPTWQIEAVPRSDDIAKETGYEKSVVWVRQDNYVVVRAVRFLHKSRRRRYMQVTNLERIDNIWIAAETQMVTKDGQKTEHATTLKQSDIKFNQPLDDALFTLRQLEKGP